MPLTPENKRARNRYLGTLALLIVGIILNVAVRRYIAGWPPQGGVFSWALQLAITLTLAFMVGVTVAQAERKRVVDKRKRHRND